MRTGHWTARYEIVKEKSIEPILYIRDLGPWDKYPTVTNAAEGVVKALVTQGLLPEGRRLWYYDSENELDEILIKDGKFAGFKPIPTGPGCQFDGGGE